MPHRKPHAAAPTPYEIPQAPPEFLNLSVVQNFNQHPAEVLAEIAGHHAQVLRNISGYPYRGDQFDELTERLAAHAGVPSDHVLVTSGSGTGLALILASFPRSRVVAATPNYPGFIHDARLCGELVSVPVDNGSVRGLSTFIKFNAGSAADAKNIFYISTPNIPLGYEVDLAAFEQLMKAHRSALFIVDEAYVEYGRDLLKPVRERQPMNVFFTRTMSKAFGLAGARVGCVIAHPRMIAQLRVRYCTKSVPEFSVLVALSVMRRAPHYISAASADVARWAAFAQQLAIVATAGRIICGVCWSGCAPFILLETEHPAYVVDLFYAKKILVRDKTVDVGRGCIRLTLGDVSICDRVLAIVRQINGFGPYDRLYLDMDGTIRATRTAAPAEGIAAALRAFPDVCFVTNSTQSRGEILAYLTKHGLPTTSLICPFDWDISDQEYEQGYFYRAEAGLFLTKFPNITNELMLLLTELRRVHVVEQGAVESTGELGDEVSIERPFIGAFQEMIGRVLEVEFVVIGKQALTVDGARGTVATNLMIGDSEDDFLFAKRNGFCFRRVAGVHQTLGVLAEAAGAP